MIGEWGLGVRVVGCLKGVGGLGVLSSWGFGKVGCFKWGGGVWGFGELGGLGFLGSAMFGGIRFG